MIRVFTWLLAIPLVSAQLGSLFHSLTESLPQLSVPEKRSESLWIHSGKFQGDIDGIDERILRSTEPSVMMNALKNKQLTWSNAVIPYILDDAFSQGEVRALERAFSSYKKRTCIRFRPRDEEYDYLYITKGYGCYSQVGRTGGKQELSLGRGCLFHEIIVHELMHSLGFWHEHSRSDRDDHIRIRWENILTGMKSQFDIISPALQDTLGLDYDYKSIMHYDSTAFSRNGQNTIETTVNGFTTVIGSATDLSELDVQKINKLYKCGPFESKTTTKTRTKSGSASSSEKITKPLPRLPFLTSTVKPTEKPDSTFSEHLGATDETEVTSPASSTCQDHFVDCPNFKEYCQKVSFFYVMKAYCPRTCNHCQMEKVSLNRVLIY
uniref:Metalloendopeptidase n=1 Tax=Acrobeloides nanus TaxID=290746 RepID=A0A914BVX0_9BILA